MAVSFVVSDFSPDFFQTAPQSGALVFTITLIWSGATAGADYIEVDTLMDRDNNTIPLTLSSGPVSPRVLGGKTIYQMNSSDGLATFTASIDSSYTLIGPRQFSTFISAFIYTPNYLTPQGPGNWLGGAVRSITQESKTFTVTDFTPKSVIMAPSSSEVTVSWTNVSLDTDYFITYDPVDPDSNKLDYVVTGPVEFVTSPPGIKKWNFLETSGSATCSLTIPSDQDMTVITNYLFQVDSTAILTHIEKTLPVGTQPPGKTIHFGSFVNDNGISYNESPTLSASFTLTVKWTNCAIDPEPYDYIEVVSLNAAFPGLNSSGAQQGVDLDAVTHAELSFTGSGLTVHSSYVKTWNGGQYFGTVTRYDITSSSGEGYFTCATNQDVFGFNDLAAAQFESSLDTTIYRQKIRITASSDIPWRLSIPTDEAFILGSPVSYSMVQTGPIEDPLNHWEWFDTDTGSNSSGSAVYRRKDQNGYYNAIVAQRTDPDGNPVYLNSHDSYFAWVAPSVEDPWLVQSGSTIRLNNYGYVTGRLYSPVYMYGQNGQTPYSWDSVTWYINGSEHSYSTAFGQPGIVDSDNLRTGDIVYAKTTFGNKEFFTDEITVINPVTITIQMSQPGPFYAGDMVSFNVDYTRNVLNPTFTHFINGAAVGSISTGYDQAGIYSVSILLTDGYDNKEYMSNIVTFTVNELPNTVTVNGPGSSGPSGNTVMQAGSPPPTFTATTPRAPTNPVHQWNQGPTGGPYTPVSGANSSEYTPDIYTPAGAYMITHQITDRVGGPNYTYTSPPVSFTVSVSEPSNYPSIIVTSTADEQGYTIFNSVVNNAPPGVTYSWVLNGVSLGISDNTIALKGLNSWDRVQYVMHVNNTVVRSNTLLTDNNTTESDFNVRDAEGKIRHLPIIKA